MMEKIGGGEGNASITNVTREGNAAQVQEPVAGNVRQGLDVDVLFRVKERQDFLGVDMRRLE